MVSVDRPALRALADGVADLFERDRLLAVEQKGAQRRLLGANDRRAMGLAGDGVRADVQQAFVAYSFAAEKRRELAAEVGEATGDLIAAMQAAGFSDRQARQADVWALRDSVYQEGGAER